MIRPFTILFAIVVCVGIGCRSSKAPAETVSVSEKADNELVSIKAMSIYIDGAEWQAATYGINQMGTFWVVKGTHEDGSVFSVMLPDPLATTSYAVAQGGPVSVTYSTTRENGFTFFAPYSANNGSVKTSVQNGYLHGSLDVTLSNNAIQKKCVGVFTIKL